MKYARKRKFRPGQELELNLERVFDQVNALPDILVIRLEVKTVTEKRVHVAKQPADYLVVTPTTTWLLDAKECGEKKWYPANKKVAHQVAAMRKMQGMGQRAGFIIWFKELPWPFGVRLVEDFDSPATVNSGVQFGWDIFF